MVAKSRPQIYDSVKRITDMIKLPKGEQIYDSVKRTTDMIKLPKKESKFVECDGEQGGKEGYTIHSEAKKLPS